MATGYGNSTLDGSVLLARLSDSDEDTTDTDDSFDCLEAGMAAGDFEEVSSSCSEAIDSCVSDGNGESDSDIDDPSLPGPSSGPINAAGFSSDSDSDADSDDESSDSSSSNSSGRPPKRTKRNKKPANKWNDGSSFVPRNIKTFDESNVGMQAPYQLPVDAKEVEYFKLYFDGELVGDIKQESNRYADQLLTNPTAQTKSLRDWVATTTNELYAFFALVILMGVIVKKSMKDYWSKRAVIETPFFLRYLAVKGFSKSCVYFIL